MRLPEIGELNRRVVVQRLKHSCVGEIGIEESRETVGTFWSKREVIGGVNYWNSINLDVTVTHRFYFRAIRGKTTVLEFNSITHLLCDGLEYRVKRVTDVSDKGRFTLVDCEELGQIRAEEGLIDGR